MTSIVIPLGSGSPHQDIELRFTLRGIEQFLFNVGQVFIIGTCPKWLNMGEVIHIPFEEKDHYRFLTRNIHQKIETACNDKRVSEDFLFMNDDHFLLRAFDARNFPYHHTGPSWLGRGKYLQTMADTRQLLGEGINNYDTHAPVLINKQKYLHTVALADWKKHFGYCIKTMYCVMNNISGEYYPDLKLNRPLSTYEVAEQVTGRPYFSIGDKALNNEMKDYLNILYPKPSKYEL